MTANVKLSFDGELRIDGAPVFDGSLAELTDVVLASRLTGMPGLVVTPNVDQVINLSDDAEWRSIFSRAMLRVVDGAPISLLGRWLGARRVARLPGADLLPHFAEVAAERNLTMVITGGSEESLARGVEQLAADHAGGKFLAVPFPYVDDVSDPACRHVVAQLSEAEPDIVFLCLGSPKQEKWFDRWRADLPPAAYFGAGASIDFLAGTVRRAPNWMRRAGIEWLWRVGQEPRRLFKRYFVKGPRFIAVAARSLTARSAPARK